MILFTLKLLLAHYLGDFVLQPVKWISHKFKYKEKSKYLYYHVGVHLVLLLILLQFQYIWALLITIVSHYLIDLMKLLLTSPKNARWLFFADQVLHLLIMALIVWYNNPYTLQENIFSPTLLLFICSIIFVTFVSAVLIKILLSPYIKEVEFENDNLGIPLKNAGRYIGMLERIFVFVFILLGQWSAIGLLITAKSVFRFGDLNKGKNRKLTEYVLIGTLLSFGLAILAGLAYNYLITII